MMIDKKRDVAAPCGLYCGACMLYRANKRGDSGLLIQMKEGFTRLSDLKEGQIVPGMPPAAKGVDLSRIKREVERDGYLCCEGCLSDVVAFPCRICGFRECAQEKGLTNCSQCPDMPCQWVIDFNNDGVPHHGEVLINLKRQKEIGIDAWLAEQEDKWRCIQCGSPLAWYDAQCPDCHAALSQAFNPPALPG